MERRHRHFKQKRTRKMTNAISNYIYEAKLRSKGVITSVKLHYQIQFLFNVTMTPKTIRMQKMLLKLVWRRSRKAPRLSRSQKIDRLNWCQQHFF